MSFSNTPSNDTYSTHRVGLCYGTSLRSGQAGPGIDAGMKNVLPFKEKDQLGNDVLWGETRYSIQAKTVNNTAGNITRGMYVWEKTAGTVYYFVIVNTSVYTSTDATTWTVVNTLLTSANTPVRFTEFIDAANVKKLVLVDGVEGYIFTSNTAGTKITDANFPSPHVPFPVYLDGYLFLAKANTGDIYNSDLNSPGTWTVGNFFSAQGYPDDIQALVRINNYLVAIGTSSTEYFYDGGNSPGSPLSRLEGATLPFGTQFANTIACNKDTVMLLSNNGDGEATMRLIEGQKYKDINAKFLASILNKTLSNYNKVRGYFFRQQGELFYAILTDGTTTTASPPSVQIPTFGYSFSNDMWFELDYNAGKICPITFTAPSTTGNLLTYVAGSIGGLAFFGNWSNITGSYDNLDGGSTTAIAQEIRTPMFDFGTMNFKKMSRVTLGYTCVGDSVGVIPAQITYTDDAYRTSVTPDGTLIGNAGTGAGPVSAYPSLTRLGIFRRRAFIITSVGIGSITRWQFLEFDINKMQQ